MILSMDYMYYKGEAERTSDWETCAWILITRKVCAIKPNYGSINNFDTVRAFPVTCCTAGPAIPLQN